MKKKLGKISLSDKVLLIILLLFFSLFVAELFGITKRFGELLEKEENSSENFMKGWYFFAKAIIIDKDCMRTENLASNYYREDNFDSCIEEAENFKSCAYTAKNYFANAENYFKISLEQTLNTNLKPIIVQLINCSSLAKNYYELAYESAVLRKNACIFYKHEEWKFGDENIRELNEKIEIRNSISKEIQKYYSELQTLIENY